MGREERGRTVISGMEPRRIALCYSRVLLLLMDSHLIPYEGRRVRGLEPPVKFTDLRESPCC